MPGDDFTRLRTFNDGGDTITLLHARLAPALLARLQALPEFSGEEAGMEAHGYTRCQDGGQPPGHVYYEGYFHGLSGRAGPVDALHPRLGCLRGKPAAPPLLRAFLAAFREVNERWLAALARDLAAVGVDGVFGGGRPGFDLAFADVAAQSHHGDARGVDGGWHIDGVNSLLHLAVTLRGARALHSHADGGAEPMAPGDVYLAAPALFVHGVSFPAAAWPARSLALQCRFLLPPAAHDALSNAYCLHAAAITKVVCAALAGAGAGGALALPTEVEVDAALGRIVCD